MEAVTLLQRSMVCKKASGRQDVQRLLGLPPKCCPVTLESAEIRDLQLLWTGAVRESSGSTGMAFSSALSALNWAAWHSQGNCHSGKIIPTSLFPMKQNFNAGCWCGGCGGVWPVWRQNSHPLQRGRWLGLHGQRAWARRLELSPVFSKLPGCSHLGSSLFSTDNICHYWLLHPLSVQHGVLLWRFEVFSRKMNCGAPQCRSAPHLPEGCARLLLKLFLTWAQECSSMLPLLWLSLCTSAVTGGCNTAVTLEKPPKHKITIQCHTPQSQLTWTEVGCNVHLGITSSLEVGEMGT